MVLEGGCFWDRFILPVLLNHRSLFSLFFSFLFFFLYGRSGLQDLSS